MACDMTLEGNKPNCLHFVVFFEQYIGVVLKRFIT